MNNDTKPKTKSLLSKKDRELPWQTQVQKLRRIAVRATKKADWLIELNEMYADHPVAKRDEIMALRDKASVAAEEMLAIAKANGDPRVAGL